jgi:hypothetical protein
LHSRVLRSGARVLPGGFSGGIGGVQKQLPLPTNCN